MKNGYSRFPFIMSIMAFACFLIVLCLISTAVQPLWGRALILIIPSALLFGVGMMSKKKILSSGASAAITTILSVVLVLLSAFYFVLLSVWTATTVTDDIRYYERAYRQIQYEEGVSGYFPEHIPDDAENIVFSYTPQFLQGGKVFSLVYSTGEEELIEWSERLKTAEWIGPNDEWLDTHNRIPVGNDAVRYQLYRDGGSNHGEICYVLIDGSDKRIEFYYSEW